MEQKQRLILAVPPGRITAAGAWELPLAHLAYRVGGGPHLFRANTPVAPRGGLMVIDDARFDGGGEAEGFCHEVLRECAARKFTGVVCRFQGRPRAPLGEIAGRLAGLSKARGLECYVSELYGASAPDASVLLPAAVSGGTLRGRLEEAVGRFGPSRVALWVERVAEDFPLPSPSGAGAPLTPHELSRRLDEHGESVFFSHELCARYFTYMAGERGHFILFDDAASLRKKLQEGARLGVNTAFLSCDAAELVLERPD